MLDTNDATPFELAELAAAVEQAALRPSLLQVLRLTAQGYRDGEIAARMQVERRTVWDYRRNALELLPVRTREQAHTAYLLHLLRTGGIPALRTFVAEMPVGDEAANHQSESAGGNAARLHAVK